MILFLIWILSVVCLVLLWRLSLPPRGPDNYEPSRTATGKQGGVKFVIIRMGGKTKNCK